jgi:DnaD/phage-associated family protein
MTARRAPFAGFPDGKTHLTPLPAAFFTELLPHLASLAALKTLLWLIWRLDHQEGAFRAVSLNDLEADGALAAALGVEAAAYPAVLAASLAELTACGALLAAEAASESYYFLNSARGRAAQAALARGAWTPSRVGGAPIPLDLERPNIFRLYEEHVGPLTPILADQLRLAEADFPPLWIADAFRIAVENNKRSWSYIAAILRRWQDEGRDDLQNRQDSEKHRRGYIDNEYADFIDH